MSCFCCVTAISRTIGRFCICKKTFQASPKLDVATSLYLSGNRWPHPYHLHLQSNQRISPFLRICRCFKVGLKCFGQSSHPPFLYLILAEFFDEIEIMRSLAKPRKISIRGTDGQTYTFLGKPKDDLRKDARLMEFNSIINKLLKANSESRKRQLRLSFSFLSDGWFTSCYRYPNIWCGNFEWRMWLHPVGPKHSACPTGPLEELWCQENQKLGMDLDHKRYEVSQRHFLIAHRNEWDFRENQRLRRPSCSRPFH